MTVCPTVYIGDNGELITVAYVLGISHPPGYALFSIIGKFSLILLPLGDIAFRANVVNSVLAASAMIILYKIFLLMARKKDSALNPIVYSIAGVCSALVFAFSKTFWSQVIVAEVYVINIFILLLMIYILLLWDRKYGDDDLENNKNNLQGFSDLSSGAYFYLLMFVAGLGMMNHYTIIFFAPVFLIYIIFINKKLFRTINENKIILGIIIFLLSLTIYIYMPIRAFADPILNWGDPDTLIKIKKHLLRDQYGPISKYPRSLLLFWEQNYEYMKYFISQFTPFLVPFVILGAWFSYKKNKKAFWFLLSMFLMGSIILVFVLNFKLDFKELYMANIFFIPSYIIAALWLGFGLLFIFEKLKINWKISLCSLLLTLFPLNAYYKENDKHDTYFAYDYGMNMLNTMPEHSVLFTSGDNPMFLLAYLTIAHKERPDVKIYDDFGCIFENIYGEDFLFLNQREHDLRIYEKQKALIEKINIPVYYTLGSYLQKMPGVISDTAGLLYIIKKYAKEPIPIPPSVVWKKYKIGNIDNPDIIAEDYLGREISARYYFAKGEYFRLLDRKEDAMKEYNKAGEISEAVEWVKNNLAALLTKVGWVDEALKEYRRIIEINPRNAIAHNNLGVTLLGQGKAEEAMQEFKTAIEIEEGYADAHNNLGNVYYKKGMLSPSVPAKQAFINSAKSEFEKALQSNPNHSDAWSNLGDIYLDQGDFEKAIECYNRVIAVNPYHIKSLLNLGGAYFKRDQFDGALQVYRRILEIEPNSADAYNNIGVIYGKLGRLDEAVRMWQQALKINPNHRDALINMQGARNMRK